MENTFGRLIRRHQNEIGLDDEAYRRAVADEGLKYGLRLVPIHRNTLARWRKGYPPNGLHAVLVSDLTGIPGSELGELIGRRMTEDGMRRAVIDAGGDPDVRDRTPARRVVATSRLALAERTAGELADVDWSRIARNARSIRWVDEKVVDDQWTITRNYIASLSEISPRALLDLISDHMTRLRQLQTTTPDDRLRRQLTVMQCQMAICAGVAWTGLTDYGLAMEAYRYCVRLAEEAGEDWLRATGLVLQAQLYGGALQRRLALSPARIRSLIDAAEAGARIGVRPETRTFVHSTRSTLLALLSERDAALRAIDLAHRAEAQVLPEVAFYFTAEIREYRAGNEAGTAIALGRPMEAVQLYSEQIGRTVEKQIARQVWFRWGRAEAHLQAGAIELAATETQEALQMARQYDVPFLRYGVEKVAETLMSRFGRMPAVQELEAHLLEDT